MEFVKRGLPCTQLGWEIAPDGLCETFTRVTREYGPLPRYVTENGAAFPDEVTATGRVHDEERRACAGSRLRAAHRARSDGVDLRGSVVWTLLDNSELAHGYSKRFGLVPVDVATHRRTVKDSGRWFAGVTRANAV